MVFQPYRLVLDKSGLRPNERVCCGIMNSVKVYEEVIDFIAAGTTPQNVIAFRPSDAAQERLEDLLSRAKEDALSAEEKSELDHYLQLEHLMRLAKARARDFLPNE